MAYDHVVYPILTDGSVIYRRPQRVRIRQRAVSHFVERGGRLTVLTQ